jgi:hypothetical protein
LLRLATGVAIEIGFRRYDFRQRHFFRHADYFTPSYFIFLSLFIFERFLQDTPAAAAGHAAFDIAAGAAADAFS